MALVERDAMNRVCTGGIIGGAAGCDGKRWVQWLAATFFSSARAVCEWSRRWQTGSAKDEHGGWQLLAARGWRAFCVVGGSECC